MRGQICDSAAFLLKEEGRLEGKLPAAYLHGG